MALKDLSPKQKTTIALQAIVGDVLGKTSSDIGAQFGVNKKTVTLLKNQAIEAVRIAFSEVQRTNTTTSSILSDEELSIRVDKLLGSGSVPALKTKANTAALLEDKEDDEEIIPIDQIVSAIEVHNNGAGKDGKKIFISRAIVTEISPHPVKELESYFAENKTRIEAHHKKHDLKRTSNRVLKGEDWISWLTF